MNKEELERLSNKVQNNTATQEEMLALLKMLNNSTEEFTALLKNLNSAIQKEMPKDF